MSILAMKKLDEVNATDILSFNQQIKINVDLLKKTI